MKNFIPKSEVEKTLEHIQERVKEGLLNTIEKPMTTEEASKFLGFENKKTFQNQMKKYPHHRINGRVFFYKSELNQFIKRGEI